MTRKKVAVILSGCGVFDGTEIQEAVCTLLALDQHDCEYECLSPDKDQMHVINHMTQEPETETRNVLKESARIARGEIRALSTARPINYDGIILPGGFGAAKNLSTFAIDSSNYEVDETVAAFLNSAHMQEKPIGFLCISPVIAAKIFGDTGLTLTIGTDEGIASAIESCGASHKNSNPTDIVIDKENRIISTPCYMNATRISEIYTAVNKTIEAMITLI